MTIEYNKNTTLTDELINFHKELIENSKLKVGNVVGLKGSSIGPDMVITTKKVNSRNVIRYDPKVEQLYLEYETIWFNKSIQDFKTRTFNEESLVLITK